MSIALRGVRKTYGRTTALDGLELEVHEGEFFCLLGPSGAGKTTTLKTVAGLEQPDSGTVELDGTDMTGVEPYDRGVAMCFESYALYPHRSAYDNLASPLRSPRHRLPAAEARDRIGAIAELLGISGLLDRPVGQLSNGQRQRIALGRVLVRPARAFLLDEPLSHLDAKLRQSMRAELKAIGAVQHTTTLYVTHDSVEALALGDRIGVIRDGRIVQTGTREEIWYRPYDTEVARAFGRPRINLLPGTITEGGGFRSADGGGAPWSRGAKTSGEVELPLGAEASPGTDVLVGVRPRDLALEREGHGTDGRRPVLTGTVYVTEVLGRAVEVTVRLGGQHVSLVAPRAEATHLRPDDPVRLTVRPENLLLFEADRPERPGRRIETSTR
ncbi:sugar ABC transporter ATP-binding protein [Streptomyces albiflavescens]|uniref:Sugar ABC transporter ATP-binding protein n=1 Tax=Streptomyces albiflavescens TaxID=1623582 RepID=A0A917XWU5_9ACTN|nr:ABC transporter ATP-binding protein [Streptomyces albiflavescens]GGN55081.1 sugar ABC transporter ATP-binding protein [Streptomyces albiflavescens]